MNLAYSAQHVDYLQRTDYELDGKKIRMRPEPVAAETPMTRAAPIMRRITDIGVFEKPDRLPVRRNSGTRVRLPTEDLITSLYENEIYVGFVLNNSEKGATLSLGAWRHSDDGQSAEALAFCERLLETSLTSLYPAIRYRREDQTARFDVGGYALGIPSIKIDEEGEPLYPYDKLLRAMVRVNWSCLVLAQPVKKERIVKMRDSVINEMRVVKAAVDAERTPSPLAEYYLELLKSSLKSLSSSMSTGCWRTAVYLMGDMGSYPRLTSMWRGIFSGEDSQPEPVRIWESEDVPNLAAAWAMPDVFCPAGPGNIRHLVQSQTILSSTQLSAYVHFPKYETRGFSVKMVPEFDLVPAVATGDERIRIGKVIPQSRLLPPDVPDGEDRDSFVRKWYETALPDSYYEVGLDALTKHVFVAGVTGAGKTRTIFTILKNAFRTKPSIPFLVIEPAKTEYRELLNHPEVGEKLQIFSPGNENESPFRLNPFEVPEGTSIAVHIDLLRSVFSASFGWWNPIPQIFDKCAGMIYRDRGWDVSSDFNFRSNTRAKNDWRLFPTLSDLQQKADEVIPTLGYDGEARGRVQGHFRATLLGLSSGPRGRMLDVQQSLVMSVLLDNPTVLELEGLGDDDDKAFMMGLLLIRMVEHRRSPQDRERAAADKGLRHLLVVEEAHRLLTNVESKSQEGAANPRAKAVEGFTNMLAEIRNYGQGVIIADQVPTKLARDVIKNTNLKIAHRVVDEPDRETLGGSMVMTKKQALAIATLLPGQAAIFSEGDDAPLLVHVAPGIKQPVPDGKAIKRTMGVSRVLAPHREVFLRHPGCADTGENGGYTCEAAKLLVATPTFRRDLNRLVLSALADDTAAARLWPPIETSVDQVRTNGMDRNILLKCIIAWGSRQYAFRRGFQGQWSIEDTAQFEACLQTALLSIAGKASITEPVDRLRAFLFHLSEVKNQPYSLCRKICDGEPPRCLYRSAVADIVDSGTFKQQWDSNDPFNPGNAQAQWLGSCVRVANALVEFHLRQTVPFRQIGLCYQQIMLNVHGADQVSEAKDKLVEALFVPSGHRSETQGK